MKVMVYRPPSPLKVTLVFSAIIALLLFIGMRAEIMSADIPAKVIYSWVLVLFVAGSS